MCVCACVCCRRELICVSIYSASLRSTMQQQPLDKDASLWDSNEGGGVGGGHRGLNALGEAEGAVGRRGGRPAERHRAPSWRLHSGAPGGGGEELGGGGGAPASSAAPVAGGCWWFEVQSNQREEAGRRQGNEPQVRLRPASVGDKGSERPDTALPPAEGDPLSRGRLKDTPKLTSQDTNVVNNAAIICQVAYN